jgi:adenylyl-sulfate kinase
MGGAILWFTGLSGAGKSTLADAIAARLRLVQRVEILDGDEVRAHLSKGLGFSREDRNTNVRRIGFVARLLARNGVLVITAAISPYAETRDEMRRLAGAEHIPFIEIFANPTLDALIARDVKGLYQKALTGEIEHFTGISDPYEPPVAAELMIRTDVESIGISAERILRYLNAIGLLTDALAA